MADRSMMGSAPTSPLSAPVGRVTEIVGSPDTEESLDTQPLVSRPPVAPGMRINQYEIIRELGRGGMGTVYLARDTRLARRVAIKFLHSSEASLTQRFLVEARATAQCGHENIVVIHEVNEYGEQPFMVLEHLRGRPLTALLAAGPLSASRAVELIVPVVRALVCAHALDIVHRDLKPDNVFVTESGTVKVLDFGIAKVLMAQELHEAIAVPEVIELRAHGQVDGLTSAGVLVGTLPYMSPEQRNLDEIDHRTDVWAVGLMLYELLAGRHPLAPLTREKLLLVGLLDEPMPSMRDAGVDVPDALVRIVDHCLAKSKQDRMPSAQALLDALEPLLPGRYGRKLDAGESPYPGLTAFQETDADRFFGRSRDVAGMLTRLRNHPLVGVVGPSGVGKSSFIRAGVIPALKSSDESWETCVLRPGRQPLAALATMVQALHVTGSGASRTLGAALDPTASVAAGVAAGPVLAGASGTALLAGAGVDPATECRELAERLAREPGYLGAVLRHRARVRGHNVLLVIDQLEELYTLVPDAEQRAAFTACLSGVADDPTAPLRVVVSIRSDFLDRVVEDPHFMTELASSLVFLPPPDRTSLQEALTQPAEIVGYRFESGDMIEHMLDTLESTPGALPLLQFAATRLWETRDTGRRMLTAASYESIGGIVGALASHADAVVGSLPASEQSLARAVFHRLVTPERTRAITSIDELRALSPEPGKVQHLVDRLVGARLLVVQTGNDAEGATVEIVHESLIHGWPLLRRWLEEHEEDAVFLEQLRTVAKQWAGKARPQGLLWRGETLEEARRWHRRYQGPLTPLQREYLQVAFALADRAARVKRVMIAGVIGFLMLLVAASSVALVRIRRAEKSAQQQASAARSAALQVREQLELLQAKEREKVAALGKQEEAEAEADRAYEEVDLKQAALAQANERLRAALAAAERARARAENESTRARTALGEAELAKAHAEDESTRAHMATEAEREARAELERLLQKERERAERLERKLGTFSSTLK
jgi:serine/threonine protein kinase